MNIIQRISAYFGFTLETGYYITIRKTELKTKTGRLSGVYLSDNLVIEAAWLWTSGDLKGYRKILSGNYLGYYVNDLDLNVYVNEPPTEPTAYVILYEPDGSSRRFEEISSDGE